MPNRINDYFKYKDFTGNVQFYDGANNFFAVLTQNSKYKRNCLEKLGNIFLIPHQTLHTNYHKTESKLLKLTIVVCAFSFGAFAIIGVCFYSVGRALNKDHILIKRAIVQLQLFDALHQQLGHKPYYTQSLDWNLRYTLFNIQLDRSTNFTEFATTRLLNRLNGTSLEHDFYNFLINKKDVKKSDLLLVTPLKLNTQQEFEKNIEELLLKMSPNVQAQIDAIKLRLNNVFPLIQQWQQSWFSIVKKIKANNFDWNYEKQHLLALTVEEPPLQEKISKHLDELLTAKSETEPKLMEQMKADGATLKKMQEIIKTYIEIVDQLKV